jgi:hypothetical protein
MADEAVRLFERLVLLLAQAHNHGLVRLGPEADFLYTRLSADGANRRVFVRADALRAALPSLQQHVFAAGAS